MSGTIEVTEFEQLRQSAYPGVGRKAGHWTEPALPSGPAFLELLSQSEAVPFLTGHCCCSVPKSCQTLCNTMDCSPPGSTVHGILQTRILGWVAIPVSWGSFWPSDQTHISWWVTIIAGLEGIQAEQNLETRKYSCSVSSWFSYFWSLMGNTKPD